MSVALWTAAALIAQIETTCPTAALIASHLPPDVGLPAKVSIESGRLSMSVILPDGVSRVNRGLAVGDDCDSRARTVAAITRAWHLSWKQSKPEAAEPERAPEPTPESTPESTAELRALRRFTSARIRRAAAQARGRERPKQAQAEATPTPKVETSTTEHSADSQSPSALAESRSMNARLATHELQPGSFARSLDGTADVAAETLAATSPNSGEQQALEDQARASLAKTKLAPVTPKPRPPDLAYRNYDRSTKRWTGRRIAGLVGGLAAIGSAIALNATKAAKPQDFVPMGLYLVGSSVVLSMLITD